MKKLNVLVVDDSAFMRKVITDIIEDNPDLSVVGTAKNGQEAVEKIKELSPDIVTMDVEMPIMDGITALKIIMNEMPLPIIMLSSLTKEGADATVRALELGAIDFITKPSSIFKMNTEDMKIQLHEKLKMASKANVKSRHVLKSELTTPDRKVFNFKADPSVNNIVAIGTSTGGPRALQSVIPFLPKNIPASILIVQHMPPGFTKSLAERLNSLSEITVKEAEEDDILLPAHAYVAPGDRHMKIVKSGNMFKIKLTTDQPMTGHRPSVDYMMNSLAQLQIKKLTGVIMTGMGSDGAEGMKNIKLSGGITIGQNEESCVVYGMPKSAVNLGCVDILVSLESIAESIIKAVGV
jgi:two-component system chemotaxis response regulator CheB